MLVSNHMDFKDRHDLWVRSFKINGTQYWTRSGTLWNSIQKRTNPKSKAVSNNPSYLNVVNSFKDFQEFAEWCQSQYGYMNKEKNGKHWALDKDLKMYGNKVYSPETCIFVPNRINSLLVARNADRGDYPIGVCWDKLTKKFLSQCSNGIGRQTNLGRFNCPLEAHAAWQMYKLELIRRIIVEDEEIKNHLELVKILIDQANRIEYDLLNNIETTKE